MENYVEFKVRFKEKDLMAIFSGKCLVGKIQIPKEVLMSAAKNRLPEFNSFGRGKKKRIKRIKDMEHGWLGESPLNYYYHESIPKKIGAADVVNVLDRDTKIAIGAIIDHEIINRV